MIMMWVHCVAGIVGFGTICSECHGSLVARFGDSGYQIMCAGRKSILDISCVKYFWGHSWMYHMYTYFVLGAYCLTPAPWISPIVGTFGDIVGDTVRALEQSWPEAAMTSLW